MSHRIAILRWMSWNGVKIELIIGRHTVYGRRLTETRSRESTLYCYWHDKAYRTAEGYLQDETVQRQKQDRHAYRTVRTVHI